MLGEFANVLIFLCLGCFFIFFNLFLGSLIRPNNPYPEKLSTYECGEEPVGGAWIQFNIRFYVIALDFIIFDVEVVLLFPWAVAAPELGWYGFWAMLFFAFVLIVGLAYAWKKGSLDWVQPQIPKEDVPPAVAGRVA